MTPLAHAIAKQATLSPNKRRQLFAADDKRNIEPEELLADVHCFECTEVLDLAMELADSGKLKDVLDERIFLPAPKTWIEHRREGGRTAFLLSENPFRFRIIAGAEDGDRYVVQNYDLSREDDEAYHILGLVLSTLAIINAPHIVTRNDNPPHRGLARLWAKKVSKAPLNAWHELKLHVAKPVEIDDGEPHAEFVGGRRALHFCRAHLRIRYGRLEYVTSHWRGDPALGTKLTKYSVQR